VSWWYHCLERNLDADLVRPRRRDFLRAWLRSFAVQGSWNYRTLVASGVSYALLPLLRRIHSEDPDRYRTSVLMHLDSFNTHPYLASLAVGALARMEYEGASLDEIARFRTALRSPLGTLGDRTVWAEWRPFCLLFAITLFGLGLDPLWCAGVFLVVFNAGHLWLRIWGFRRGWQQGRDVGRLLRTFPFQRFTHLLWPVTMYFLGAATVLLGRAVVVVSDGGASSGWYLFLVGLMVVPAFRWPNQFGRLAVGLLLTIPLLWILIAFTG